LQAQVPGTPYVFASSQVNALSLPTLGTALVTSITASTAISGGCVLNTGGSAVTARGVCWSTTSNPTIGDSKTVDAGSIGVFSSSITGLPMGTVYYVRAYATNSFGTGYGAEVSFMTAFDTPTLSTTIITSITASTAISGGAVLNSGGGAVTARGVCWSTASSPTIGDSKTVDAGTTGAFSSSITGLSAGTVYYVRAYATNSFGTGYGQEISFTATAGINAVCDGTQPTTIVDITSTTGRVWMDRNLGASQAATSATDFAAYGCLYQWGRGNDGHASINWLSSTLGIPINGTTNVLSTTDTPGNALFVIGNDWRSPVNDVLWQGSNSANNPCPSGYHIPTSAEIMDEITAYSITNSATAFSSIHKFVVAGVRSNMDGSLGAVSSFGFYWSSTTSGVLAKYHYFYDVGSQNVFDKRVHGLSVRCIKDIATVSATPTLSTSLVTSITKTTATSGGDVVSDGGTAITARGVCWSTSPSPTTADSKTVDAGTIGVFSSSITGLFQGTVYYVRAYATNSFGTSYGAEVSFVTSIVDTPTLSTATVTSMIGTTATSGGDVLNTGSDVITARGVCWSTSPAPSIADSKTVDAGTMGTFSSSITGLSVGTVYYVRAYATNSFGTGYGQEFSFIASSTINAICDGTQPTTVVDITSATGRVWMDRNLGASRAATSATDFAAYGCLYQWGRGNDGHASISYDSSTSAVAINGTITSPSTTDTPGHAFFIEGNDWRSPKNDALWQGANSANNPCPCGYHIPTDVEITAEVTAYSITNSSTAYSSIHKFVTAGGRYQDALSTNYQGVKGFYWTSTVNGSIATFRYFYSASTDNYSNVRTKGFSVRCIKNL